MSEYFPDPRCLGKVKVELDLSNYATKTDLENGTRIDTSSFAKKVDLGSLKSNVDKLDIDKLKHVPTNLSNLKSKVDKLDVDKLLSVPVDLNKLSDAVKKDVYNAKIKKNCKQANLLNKRDFDNKLKSLYKKITSNKKIYNYWKWTK